MKIKNILAAVFTMLALSIPTAYANECKIGTKVEAQEMIADGKKSGHILLSHMLTEAQVKVILDAKGPPPNAEEGKPIEMEYMANDSLAQINVYQDGCFINKLGPGPKFVIDNLIGEAHAVFNQFAMYWETNAPLAR